MRKAGYRAAANAQNEQGKDGLGILMENHNGTGNNSGAAFGDPDVKGSPLAPYANGVPLDTAARAQPYHNPPGNHPTQPNWWWATLKSCARKSSVIGEVCTKRYRGRRKILVLRLKLPIGFSGPFLMFKKDWSLAWSHQRCLTASHSRRSTVKQPCSSRLPLQSFRPCCALNSTPIPATSLCTMRFSRPAASMRRKRLW